MKQYVSLFESFEEAFDDFHGKPDTRSDAFYRRIANDLIKMANQYSSEEIDIDQYAEKYGTATRIKDLQNDLITKIYDEYGERVADDFAKESDSLLKGYEILETSSMDHKKVFAKTDAMPDNQIMTNKKNTVNYEKPKEKVTLRTNRSTKRH